MEDETAKPYVFKVLMFPWLAHGHISPFLQLSKKLITNKKFHIYFCSTKTNLNFIEKALKSHDSIELVELHLQESPHLPPHLHTTKNLPPHLMPSLMEAFQAAKTSFGTLINGLNPDLLIFDGFQSWAPVLAAERRIPAVHFITSGAATMSYFYHFRSANCLFPFPSVFLREYEMRKLQALMDSNKPAGEDFAFRSLDLSTEIVLIKSCRQLEGKYLDYLSSLCGKELVTLGPMVQDNVPSTSHHGEVGSPDVFSISHSEIGLPDVSSISCSKIGSPDVRLSMSGDPCGDTSEDSKCNIVIKSFLDSKPKSSVVFVSFGSEYFLNQEEREEMAHGLELSNVNFIWVVRFPLGFKNACIANALSPDFLERIKNKGMVVENWAPQTEILGHGSTGGFVSHCGWSSVMESLCLGVPVIALPVHLDQPTNARLLVEIGVGLEVLRDENGNMERYRIADAIKKVVFEEGGKGIREKVKGLSDMLRLKSGEEEQEAVEKVWNLCRKYKELRNGGN